MYASAELVSSNRSSRSSASSLAAGGLRCAVEDAHQHILAFVPDHRQVGEAADVFAERGGAPGFVDGRGAEAQQGASAAESWRRSAFSSSASMSAE